MAGNKNRFSITVDDDLYKKIEDFRFERRLKSQSKAVNELLLIGLASLMGKEIKLEPDLSVFDKRLIDQFNALDNHGKEIVSFVLQKEYERYATSPSPDAPTSKDYAENRIPDVDTVLEEIKNKTDGKKAI